MSDNLALMIARRRVQAYKNESDELVQRHAEVRESRDCEAFLAQGVEAFKWLKNADDTMRKADYQGVFEFSRDLRQAVDLLYQAWLIPCEFAESWIASLANRGYAPDNLSRFRSACEEAEFIVQQRDWQNAATASRVLASSEEEW